MQKACQNLKSVYYQEISFPSPAIKCLIIRHLRLKNRQPPDNQCSMKGQKKGI